MSRSAGELLGGLSALTGRKDRAGASRQGVVDVITALLEFNENVRYLNTRRTDGAVLILNSEAVVQDTIYLMLRPWVRDLVFENPSEKSGNRYTIGDFLSRSLKLIIEAKFVRDRQHGKNISKELHDDIEVYQHNPFCDTIVFFVYDPDSNIPDERELRRTIEQSRTYDGRALTCKLIVKP